MADWCTRNGAPTTRPYFSLDGVRPPTAAEWDRMRAKWLHVHGRTNVWQEPPVHGAERVKNPDGVGYFHANQKPLELMKRQILASSDVGEVVWEPFGGLMSASVAAVQTGRVARAAEVKPTFFAAAKIRVEQAVAANTRKSA